MQALNGGMNRHGQSPADHALFLKERIGKTRIEIDGISLGPGFAVLQR